MGKGGYEHSKHMEDMKGAGGCEKFWEPYSIKDDHGQPGNPLPSNQLHMSPEKAKTILRDGSVRGHPLTGPQKGLFGAIAGKGKK